jgi:outer membrane murein-binding lipoprotein Lpp
LSELSANVEKLEEAVKAAAEKNRCQLAARRKALIEKIGVMAEEWEAAKPEAEFSTQRWWAEAKSSLDAALTADTRADHEVRGLELEEELVERTAEDAESIAESAVALAAYFLNVAEWAVVEAALARGEAEDEAEVG